MSNPAPGQSPTLADWRSDASIAYAILRFTFGVNICFRGVMRIAHGTDVFAAGLATRFAETPVPGVMVEAFGRTVPFVETIVGLMIMLGLGTRGALIVGALMMTSLTFGTMLIEDFQLAWLQLGYSATFFLLLALLSWNALSVDAWRADGKR